MKQGFSDLSEYAGFVDNFFLFKEAGWISGQLVQDHTITLSDLPSTSGPTLRENFSPVRHIEPLGSASVHVDSFSLGKSHQNKLYGINGLFVDSEDIDLPNEYVHKNLLHEGDQSIIELGDCPTPISDDYGTVNCLQIVGQGGPIFFPEWDLTFPLDILIGTDFLYKYIYSHDLSTSWRKAYGLEQYRSFGTRQFLDSRSSDDVCARRAFKSYEAALLANKTGEAEEIYLHCLESCLNPFSVGSAEDFSGFYSGACYSPDRSVTGPLSPSTQYTNLQRSCSCPIEDFTPEEVSDPTTLTIEAVSTIDPRHVTKVDFNTRLIMITEDSAFQATSQGWVSTPNFCGFDLMLNQYDFRTKDFISNYIENSEVTSFADEKLFTDEHWYNILDKDLMYKTLSFNQQTDISGRYFTGTLDYGRTKIDII